MASSLVLGEILVLLSPDPVYYRLLEIIDLPVDVFHTLIDLFLVLGLVLKVNLLFRLQEFLIGLVSQIFSRAL